MGVVSPRKTELRRVREPTRDESAPPSVAPPSPTSRRHDVTTRRATLGETLILLGSLDRTEEAGVMADPVDLERAVGACRTMLAGVRASVVRGEPVQATSHRYVCIPTT